MAENSKYDLIVIGGGPAGYAAAIRAGQLGKKVACIELERAGGTCLNWGCIPSKALLKSAELYQKMKHAEDFGLHCENLGFDFGKIMRRSRGVADTMGKGIEFLFKKNKVDYFKGRARVTAPGMVEITEGEDKGRFFGCDKVLIATGQRARMLPGLAVDGKRVMTSREALAMQEMPRSIAILGAGAIGVEFAYFLNALGCQVTLIEMLPRIVPVEDEEISNALTRAFKQQGMQIHTDTKAENIQVHEHSVSIDLVGKEGTANLEVESLLVAIGVVGNSENLTSSSLKLDMDRGFIKVDDQYQTNVKGVYAAGDIVGPPWLAHVATYEALQAVNGMFTSHNPKRVKEFPGCTYCQPQVASIGMTEQAAKEKGLQYKIGKFPFAASGKAVASNNAEGFVKLIVSKEHEEILGAHIIGSEATEMIAEYGLAMNLEATAEEIHDTIHAHPTLAEAMGEAAAAAMGQAIHI